MTQLPVEATWSYARQIITAGYTQLTSSSNLLSNVLSTLSDPEKIMALYKETDPLVSALFFTHILIVVHYATSELTKNYSQVDRAWSILPGLYAWHFTLHDYALNELFHPRLLTATTLITIWGSRLTYNFARKGGYYWSGQDYRYPYLAKQLGPVRMALLNLAFIAPIQDYLLLLMVSPLYMTNLLDTPRSLTNLDYLAVVAHLSFLLIEVVADEQQYVFQTEKYAVLKYLKKDQLDGDHKHGFLWHSGLFQYSRHANFFAEQSMWCVIYLFSVAAVQQATGSCELFTYVNWTITAPLFLISLFQGSTWLTEKISTEKYPDYAIYRQSVSRLIPWFPSATTTTVYFDKKEL